MLHCIVIEDRHAADPAIMRNIFQLRHKIFCESRQWVPLQAGGLEQDGYDDLPPIHVAVIDGSRRVLGCLRMKPTDGPYMLRDIFPVLAPRADLPNHHSVWEISRFSVDEALIERGAGSSVSLVTNILLQAIFKYARQRGIVQLLGVTDLAFERLLRRAGMYTVRYSPPRRIGNCTAVAGYADVTDALIETLELRGLEIQRTAYAHLPVPAIEGLIEGLAA